MNSNDRSIIGVAMVAHAMVHTYELSIPILVTIWLQRFPVTEASIGLVVSAGYALFGIGALPGGVLADRFGSRTLIVACLLGMGGSFAMLSLSPSILVIAAALILWGAAASIYHPSGLSLLSTGVEKRGTAFAYHGMAGNVGIALGPLLTTLLLLAFDWRVVAALLALPAGVAAVFAFRVRFDETAAVAPAEPDGGREPEEPGSRPDRTASQSGHGPDSRRESGGEAGAGVSSLGEFVGQSRVLFSGGFLVVFAVVMLSGLYYRGTLTFLPQLLSGLPMFDPVRIGAQSLEPSRYLYAGLLMVGVLGQYVGGKLTDRMATERAIAVSFASLAAIALVFVPAANAGLVPLLVISAVLGFALFVVQPLYQATVAEYTPAGTRGLSYGYTYLGVFGVGAAGAAIAGAILTYASATELFVVLAGFAALASLLGGVLAVRRRSAA